MAMWTYRKTFVFWDVDDCPVPDGLDPATVSRNIRTALFKQGYEGVIDVTAFGDMTEAADDIVFSGFAIVHCPKDMRDTRRTKILTDFLCSAIGNYYEANFLLIVGDISQHLGFATALRYLESKLYYTVLLAQPVPVSSDELLRSVSVAWLWPSMARGEDPIKLLTRIGRPGDEINYPDCEGRYVAAKTAVFWDMDGCQIPHGGKADVISSNIKSALVNAGCGDTVTIYAYGDTNQIDGLESIGIMPRHFPAGGDRNDKLEKILVDALCCAVDSPKTQNLMLLMGDLSGHDEFIFAALVLSFKNYNLLVSQPDDLEEQLRTEAKEKWLWSSLSAGRGPLPLTPSFQAFMNHLFIANQRSQLES